MNGRSPIFTFFLFLFLSVLITLQFLGMVQSDRLYQRLNDVIKAVEGAKYTVSAEQTGTLGKSDETYPGDEGGWLVRALSAEPSTLFPFLESATWSTRWIVNANIYEPLIKYKPDKFEYEGHLAEDFSISEDGHQIYFKLRDDIHFSDGVPITTDDVIFTFETITNPKVDCHSYANYFKDVERYEKINDHEIKFYMKRVYFQSLGYLGGMYIHPKHVYEFDDPEEFNNLRTNPIGSGPYVFDKWEVGNRVVLDRSENYWGKKPNIEKRVFKFITNDIAALQSLESGQVDYLRPLPDQFAEKNEDEEFKKKFSLLSYWSADNTGYFWIGWNHRRPFFADRKVRLAMTHLIDRKSIKDYILRSPDAEIPTGPFYIFGPQSNPEIEPWPYDPDRAAELLNEAGWVDTDGDGVRDKDGVKFSFKYMIVAGTQLHQKIVKLVKDSAARVGIEVIPDPYEWSIFIQKVQNREFDAVNMAWGGGVESDPYQVWHSSQIEKGSNYVAFDVPKADMLIEKARMTLDKDKRNALYHRFHSIIHNQQPYTFIYTRPEQRFLDKRFENVIIHKLGIDEHEWYVPRQLQKY